MIKDGDRFDFRDDQQPGRREMSVRGADGHAVPGAAELSGGAGESFVSLRDVVKNVASLYYTRIASYEEPSEEISTELAE